MWSNGSGSRIGQALLARYDGGAGSTGRGRVPFGKYRGMDELDLACVSSVLRAQQGEPGDANIGALEDWQANLKAAMDSTTASRGDELVATGEASALWADVNLETHVAALFPRVDMPTNPFQIPLQLGNVSWYPGTENVATTETAPDHGATNPDGLRAGCRSALVVDPGRGCGDCHGRRSAQHTGAQRRGSDRRRAAERRYDHREQHQCRRRDHLRISSRQGALAVGIRRAAASAPGGQRDAG